MTHTPFFHPSHSDHSLLFVLTTLVILVISAGGGCDSIEDLQGDRVEPEEQGSRSGVERCRTGSREVLDCPQCGSQTSRTGCEPELHPRFRFEVWQMAILAEPAPEPEVQRVGWECFFWLLLPYLAQIRF